jgi:hypothetical protein
MHYHALPICVFFQFHPHWFEPNRVCLVGPAERLTAWPSFADDESVRLRKWGGSLVGPTSTLQSEYRLKQTPVLEQQFKVFLRCPKKTQKEDLPGSGYQIKKHSNIHRLVVGLTFGASKVSTGSAGVAMALHLLRRVTHAGAASVNHDQERSFAPLKVSNLSSSKGF